MFFLMANICLACFDNGTIFHPNKRQVSNLMFTLSFGNILFSVGQSQAKVIVLWFGPKMNTKVAFNNKPTYLPFNTTTQHSKLFDQFQT